MASATIKEIRNRIRSIDSTRQITRAMELVASSKLKKAQMRIEASRPYFRIIYGTLQDIMRKNSDGSLPYLAPVNPDGKAAYIVIAGDRGLAGGYNSNILRSAQSHIEGKNACVLPIGKRAKEFFENRKADVMSLGCREAERVSVGDCFTVANQLCADFRSGAISSLSLMYTDFVSVLSQKCSEICLLPLKREEGISDKLDILYEPSPEETFEAMIPEYVGGVLYGALCESRASEHAARRSAMDTATQNAEEMIDSLSLKYNQARQAAITQEITEIVAGSRQ